MNHKTKGINKQDIQMKYRPKRIYQGMNSPKNMSSQVYHQKQYSDYQIISPDQNQNEKIIHRSIKRNFDTEGNAIITTKIVREIDYNDNKNNINSNSIMNIRPKALNASFQRNNEQENKILRYSNYSNNEEMDNASGMYNNQNYGYQMFSPNSFQSQENNYTKINTYSASGVDSDGTGEFYPGYRSPGMGNIINLKRSEISPRMPNYTSGSDFDDPNPRTIGQNGNRYIYNPKTNHNYSQRIGLNKVNYRRYNLESPYTQNDDFDSPDRNYDYNAPYFRNIQIDKIRGIQPIYQEKINVMNNQIETSGDYERNFNRNRTNYRNNYLNYSEQRDTYDILNDKAVQIQSNVRGYLVRKKVLRYITLAIYYQSFCDKIQDALCSHVQAEVFNILKNKFRRNKYGRRISKDEPISNNKRRNHISTRDDSYRRGINTDINKSRNNTSETKVYNLYNRNKIIKTKDYRGIQTETNTPPKTFLRDYENLVINRTNRSNRNDRNICKKNNLNYSVNYTSEYRKFDYSVSPTKKVTHYFISSPCSHNKPHNRYYMEINGKSSNTYRSHRNINEINTFGKTGYYKYENNTSKMFQEKPDYKSGIGTRSYSRGLVKTSYSSSNQNINRCHCLDDYRKKQENIVNIYRENIINRENIRNDYDVRRDIHTHKLIQKQNERSFNRFNDDSLESDNYLSLNIVKIPHRRVSSSDKKEEIYTKTVETKEYVEDRNKKVTEEEPKPKRFSRIEMNKADTVKILTQKPLEEKSKSVSTRDIFTNTPKEPNKVSKIETINIAGKKKEIIIPKVDKDKERRDKERVEIEIERRVKERVEIEKRELERIDKERKDKEKKDQLEKEKRDREREKKDKERRDQLDKERRDKEKKDLEQMLIIEREKIIKTETERIEREMRERERKDKERRDKEERDRLERKRREEQLRIERERKKKEEQDRIERERLEKERKDKEDQLRREREEKKRREEQERIERERRIKIEQERIERERKEKERKAQLEKEKKDRERREEQIRIERERKIRIEQERLERERKEKEKEAQKKREQEEKERLQRIEIERTKIIERNRLIRLQENEKQKKEKALKEKQDKTTTDEQQVTKKVVTTTTTKKYTTSQYRTDDKNKGGTTTKVTTSSYYKPNITTVKVQEGGGGKYPSFGPNGEYILKKDCQKNLNEMKLKLEKEYEKRIEMEKKRGQDELRKNQESLEKKNKIEIEKLIEQHRLKDNERIREIEREREIIKKREIELEKLKEKEVKMGIQIETDKQKELQRQKEIEERNKKNKLIRMHKEIEINLKNAESVDKRQQTTTTTVIKRDREQDILRAKEIIRIFILSRCDPLMKKRKYFNVWRRKARLLELLENSKIIQEFCRNNLEMSSIKKTIKKWKNLSKKLFYKTRIKLLKMRPRLSKVNIKRKKLYELLRITRLTTIFSRRRFIHFIILIWHIYAKNIHKKRVNMKYLYENLLKTYMSLANDIFGNNQIENPSVQDAMYEAVTTNKFITLMPDDVPLARKHYEEMRKIKSVDNKEKIMFNKIVKSSTTSKLEIEKKEFSKKYVGKNENQKDEKEEEPEDEEKRREEIRRRRKQLFFEKYRKEKLYGVDSFKNKNYSYTATHDKYNKFEENPDIKKDVPKYDSKYGSSKDKKDDKEIKYILNKYTKTEVNTGSRRDSNIESKSSNKYSYGRNQSSDSKDNKDNKKSYSIDKSKDIGNYKTKFGNSVNVIYSSNIKPETITSTKSDNKSTYERKYVSNITTQKDNKDSKNINITTKKEYDNVIQPVPYDTYQKKVYVKTTTEEPKVYSKKVEVKTTTTTTKTTGNSKSNYVPATTTGNVKTTTTTTTGNARTNNFTSTTTGGVRSYNIPTTTTGNVKTTTTTTTGNIRSYNAPTTTTTGNVKTTITNIRSYNAPTTTTGTVKTTTTTTENFRSYNAPTTTGNVKTTTTNIRSYNIPSTTGNVKTTTTTTENIRSYNLPATTGVTKTTTTYTTGGNTKSNVTTTTTGNNRNNITTATTRNIITTTTTGNMRNNSSSTGNIRNNVITSTSTAGNIRSNNIASTTGNLRSINNNNISYSYNRDNNNSQSNSLNKYGSKENINNKKGEIKTELHKSNTESKMTFAYKSSNIKEDGNKYGGKVETKIEKKYEIKPNRSGADSSQDSKKVITITKSFQSKRYNK